MVRYGVVLVGLCYLGLAYAGFAAVSDDTTHFGGGLYGGNTADLVWGVFGVNTALNFIHLVLGVFTIICGVSLRRSRVTAWCVVAGFTVLFLYGVIAVLVNNGTTSLAITWGNNILHLATAVFIAVATLLVRTSSRRPHALSRQ